MKTTTRSSRPAVLGVAAALLALGGLLALAGGRTSTRAPVTPALPAAGPALAPSDAADRAAGALFRIGDVLHFDVRSERGVRLEPVAARGRVPQLPAVESEVALRGAVTLRVHDGAPGGGWLLGFEIADVVASLRSTGAGHAGDRLAEVLSGEVLAELASSGRFGRVHYPDEMPEVGRRCWKHLLATLEMTRSDAEAWEAEEESATGTYVAQYRRQTAAGAWPAEIVKTTREYLNLKMRGHAARASIDAVEGRTLYVLDPLPLRVQGAETIRATIGNRRVVARTAFEWVRTRTTPPPANVADRPAAPRDSKRGDRRRAPGARGLPEGARLLHAVSAPRRVLPPADARRALDELVERLDTLEPRGRETLWEQKKTLSAMVKLLRERPELAHDVLSRLDGEVDRERAASLIAVLGASNTPEGQDALYAILDDSERPDLQRRLALASLIQIVEPAPKFDGAVRRLGEEHEELRANSLLALSAMADRIRHSDRKRFDRIGAHVEARLDEARSLPELMAALAALENLGPAHVPARAREALGHDAAPVRVAAVRSLLRIRDPEVDAVAARMARADESDRVRIAALEVLFLRTRAGHGLERPALARVLGNATNDEAESVRRFAADLHRSLTADATLRR